MAGRLRRRATRTRTPFRIVDAKGFIKLQQSNGTVREATCSQVLNGRLKDMWEEMCVYKGDIVSYPDMYLVIGGHIVEMVGMVRFDQAAAIARSELSGIDASENVVLIGVPNA